MNTLTKSNTRNIQTEADQHAALLADWQAKVISDGTAEIRTNRIWAWARHDQNLGDFFVEGAGRTPDQIYRAFFRIKTLDYEELMRAFAEKKPAPRPARLGDPFNGFFNTCTLAFFLDYCRRFCLDADDLMFSAYGENYGEMPEELQEAIRAQADWEGVEYPDLWGFDELIKLQNMLTNINYHQLRDEVIKLAEIGIFEGRCTIAEQPSLLLSTNLPDKPT